MKNKIIAVFSAVWDAFDIGKDSEPEEYKGKPLLAYYDDQHTLETAAAHAWNFLIESPARSNPFTQAIDATEQAITERKSWLLDLSRPVIQNQNSLMSGETVQSI